MRRKLIGRSGWRLAAASFVVMAACATARAATAAASVCGGSWESYTFDGEEFSVALPEMPALDHNTRAVRGTRREVEPVRMYGAYGDAIVYLMRAYDRPRPDEDADFFARYYAATTGYTDKPLALAFAGETTLGGFAGRRYTFVSDVMPDGVPVSSLRVYVTRRHAYVLRVVGAGDEHPCVVRFFDSFKLTDNPTGRQIVDDSKDLDAPKAKSDGNDGKSAGDSVGPGTRTGIGMGIAGGFGTGVMKGAREAGGIGPGAAAPGDDSRTFTAKEVTRKAVVVSRPEPGYTERARKNEVEGEVRLRVILNSNGTVSKIAAYTRLPDGLTGQAISAARHIKFIPAEKDGRRVSQYVTIQYNFKIY